MYILFTGAPGSKWSGVAESIHKSPDIDQSDGTSERSYFKQTVKHTGAYFDPGMEFENTQENWNKPFSGRGIRIIKSHTFAHQLDLLKTLKYPIVMVYRNDVECYKWWNDAGGFSITYPSYDYFKPLGNMWNHIQKQNKDIMQFIKDNQSKVVNVVDSLQLCELLKISFSKKSYKDYTSNDIKVYVYL